MTRTWPLLRQWLLLAAVATAFLGTAPLMAEEAETTEPVAVGQEVPDFTLTASDGGEHTLSTLRGEKNVLLVFFRGAW